MSPSPAGGWRRVFPSEVGGLPVLLGLGLTWLVFFLANERFLSAVNLTNLMLQISAMGMIAAGIVLLLLIGETDLSAGAVSGLAAGVMTVLHVKHQVPPVPALVAGLATGAAIGAFQGLWVTRLRIPSFVVTLAGSLAWQGALLAVLGDTGSVNLFDPLLTGLTVTFLAPLASGTVGALVIAASVGTGLWERRRRMALGLESASVGQVLLRRVPLCGAVVGALVLFSHDRGLPLTTLLFTGVLTGLDILLKGTRFGRHVFAVGGNAEAARRAGLPVERIRITLFMLGSTLAAAGGILAASRLLAVTQSSGGGDVLLNAIGAAVIGGTSLFGGRGSAWSALLGALVIGSISNGMDLLALSSAVKFMVTGGVLLVAVSLDALSRRGRQAAGRA